MQIKKIIISALSLSTVLTMSLATAQAKTIKPAAHPIKHTHSTFPHPKRVHLTPTFHSQKTETKGKYVAPKVKKSTFKKPAKIKTSVPKTKIAKIKSFKIPKQSTIKLKAPKPYKAPKLPKFKVPTPHFKIYTPPKITMHIKL